MISTALILLLVQAQAAHPPVPEGSPGAWFNNFDYPPEARRAGVSGRVGIELDVAADGSVSGCRITQSSGSVDLDETTCRVASKRARFKPARDANGEPVAARFPVPGIRWNIAEGQEPTGPIEISQSTLLPTSLETEVVVDGAGIVKSCRVIEAKPLAVGDPCAGFATGTKVSRGQVRKGRPVDVVIRRKTTVITTVR
ncbi:energy transducer TonB [Sphingomonas sp.]|uniref:energy transducer TonB n=1 Tax=Sphingomonas sp. TaxID=28214 RepID=UPI002C316539|nr:energy transducer TonB [Sphingomonas sp.]HWK36194.1 energy transducer TonB [Sphingomonas sp.]